MADTINVNEYSIDTGLIDATNACLDYLCKITGYQRNNGAFIGDRLGDEIANAFAFLISGGPDQAQNRQCPRPGKRYLADAQLIGQYKDLGQLYKVCGAMMNALPAYEDDKNDDSTVPSRGIRPNVGMFEITDHPVIFSRIVSIGEKEITLWMLLMRFRVEYNNNKA